MLIKIEPCAYEKGLIRDRLIPKIPEEAKISLEKITKTNLVSKFKDRLWLRKVSLERGEDYIKWKYRDFIDVYIKEDGFYVSEEDYASYPLKVLRQRAWLIFSVLRDAGMIRWLR